MSYLASPSDLHKSLSSTLAQLRIATLSGPQIFMCFPGNSVRFKLAAGGANETCISGSTPCLGTVRMSGIVCAMHNKVKSTIIPIVRRTNVVASDYWPGVPGLGVFTLGQSPSARLAPRRWGFFTSSSTMSPWPWAVPCCVRDQCLGRVS
jgi:hypothetical protein